MRGDDFVRTDTVQMRSCGTFPPERTESHVPASSVRDGWLRDRWNALLAHKMLG